MGAAILGNRPPIGSHLGFSYLPPNHHRTMVIDNRTIGIVKGANLQTTHVLITINHSPLSQVLPGLSVLSMCIVLWYERGQIRDYP